MDYKKFISFNVIGGVAWILIFTFLGFFFGNIPTIKDNFEIVIFAIIGISVIPMILEVARRRNKKVSKAKATTKSLEKAVKE